MPCFYASFVSFARHQSETGLLRTFYFASLTTGLISV